MVSSAKSDDTVAMDVVAKPCESPVNAAREDPLGGDRQTRPAAFLDRDGVLNVDVDYLHRIEDFVWVPGAREAVALLNAAGYHVFVFTNQSGVARGYYPEAAVGVLHDWMQGQLAEVGAHVDDFRYCPHHPKGSEAAYARDCDCRKPAPGMIRDLMAAWPVRMEGSFVIGDKQRDLDAGAAVGLPGFLFEEGRLDDFVKDVLDRV